MKQPAQPNNYPATQIVHWPTGPVAVCDDHARGLKQLAGVLGAHVVSSLLDKPAVCVNCRNAAGNDDSRNE